MNIIVKNDGTERNFRMPYSMVQNSIKLKNLLNSGETITITDVEIDVFNTFINLFSEYYNNETDVNTTIETIIDNILTSKFQNLQMKLMIFITNYEFTEIHEIFKQKMHDLINNNDLSKIQTIFV